MKLTLGQLVDILQDVGIAHRDGHPCERLQAVVARLNALEPAPTAAAPAPAPMTGHDVEALYAAHCTAPDGFDRMAADLNKYFNTTT